MRPRLFIFGIDGGTFDLVDGLVAQGHLPNLAALLARGASAGMDCTWPSHTAPGWASLVTARAPGYHGIYQFFDTQEPSYRARVVGSSDYGCATLWDWLALQGWTLGLINVPMSHPPRQLPGYQITWPLSNTIRYSCPHTLLGELANHGVHFQSDLATMYRGNHAYIHEALGNIRARLRSLEYLLTRHPVDAVMFVLTEVDRVCHHYWHFSDPAHPQFVTNAESAYQTAIRDIYKAVDDALGQALRLIPEEATVVVVSDHGFGPGYESFSIQRFLEETGYLKTRPIAGGDHMSAKRQSASWFSDGGRELDWAGTRLYMPVPGSFGLNVNLRGRQRQGVVDERERAGLLEEVSAVLADVKSPTMMTPAFARILLREEAYPGPLCERAPDLLLVPRDESLMVEPSLEGNTWGLSYQTGLHRYVGMWIHASPRVRAGRLTRNIQITDVAPTLLGDLGMSIPDFMRGQAHEDILTHTPRRVHGDLHPPPWAPQQEETGLSEVEEDEATSERLRKMGYL